MTPVPLPDGVATPIETPDRRIAAQDRPFAEELLALSRPLRRFAVRLTADTAAAEDLVQDTFLRAWKARHHYVFGTSMRAWTFTILKRLYLTDVRRLRFVGTFDDTLERTLATGEVQSDTVYLAEVRQALSRLPDEQRDALQMIGIEELSYEEAAVRADVPLGTIKSRVSRARHALVRVLRDGRLSQPRPRPSSARPIDRWRAARASGGMVVIG